MNRIGNPVDKSEWWTPQDAKAFEDRASCFVNQYGSFTALEEVKVNGKLTLGENTADSGGLRIALMAYLTSRANGVVANMPEFQKAFSCKSDAPMVRQTACRVW